MECKECGTCLDREAHDNYICFDCWCLMDLAHHEELQKKNSEEEQDCIPITPTPSHLGEFVDTAGRLTAGVTNVVLSLQMRQSQNIGSPYVWLSS